MNSKRAKIKEKQLIQEERLKEIQTILKSLKKQEITEENYEIVTCIRGMMAKGEDIDVFLEKLQKKNIVESKKPIVAAPMKEGENADEEIDSIN